jgi:glycosyltransferase involved in cell wall biosynthesis
MEKKLSVIIPCFNYGRYLGECIESVLNQSEKAHEIIVVDDESTDNTKDVCAKYPVKYVWQKNKGLSGARNTGISHATGDHIMCLDADDMLRPDAIKEHMKIADEHSIAQCGLLYFGTQVAQFRPNGATLQSLLRSNSIYCNSVFPRKAWEKVKYDESDTMRLGLEDWLFWLELFANGYTLKTSNYISLLYRRHGNAMTQNTTHPRWNEITQYMKEKMKRVYNLDSNFHSITDH